MAYNNQPNWETKKNEECCHKPGRWQYDEDEDTPCTEKLSETELTEKEYIEHPDRKIGYRPFKGHGEMERGWYCYEHRECYPTEEEVEANAEYRRNTTIKFFCGKCSKEIPHPDDPYDEEAWYAGGVGPACPNCCMRESDIETCTRMLEIWAESGKDIYKLDELLDSIRDAYNHIFKLEDESEEE